ncbi:hypothetical protein ABZ721_40135 [Streptomyces sp. NPDC006733]|uniref:hypothetical protein n=1 Tax=Streptomyces sp. NPDC006733 TaxID=3155460 RepID=UPI0033C8FF00
MDDSRVRSEPTKTGMQNETMMAEPIEPADRARLLELTEWMGMDEESRELRAEISQHECVERVTRICRLAGLPLSQDGGPGLVITPVRDPDPVIQAYLGTGVTVWWQVPPELDRASDEARSGDAADQLSRAITFGMQTLLADVLETGGCRTVRDSLQGDLVVRQVTPPAHTDTLYQTPPASKQPSVG